MVQYIITPWRSRRELLDVRSQIFRDRDDGQALTVGNGAGPQDARRDAVARIAMWVQRGGCPHIVESTALLVSAVLADEDGVGDRSEAGEAAGRLACRAAYAAAFSRCVLISSFCSSCALRLLL